MESLACAVQQSSGLKIDSDKFRLRVRLPNEQKNREVIIEAGHTLVEGGTRLRSLFVTSFESCGKHLLDPIEAAAAKRG